MTKKAEKAAEVAANKRSAWNKKLQNLVGHISLHGRINRDEKNARYDAGVSAETYAAELTSREPVGKAVHPLKVEAVRSARERMEHYIEQCKEKLEAADWNVNAVAPYPPSSMNRFAYQAALREYQFYAHITKWQDDSQRGRLDRAAPRYVEMNPVGCASEINWAERNAAFQYDEFICKLVVKVGECDSAELDGSHVWSESILTVRKGEALERWKTHQIWNVSKLGKDFPQWPTRMMKGGAA